MEDIEQRPTCRRYKQEIVGMGYHLRPTGTADEMLGNLELDAQLTGSGELDPELGATLAEGWDSCIPCMAMYGAESLLPAERVRLQEALAEMIRLDEEAYGHGSDTAP